MAKILSIRLDPDLLYTRNLVLQQTGAEVYSAKIEPALALLEAQFFDVVILCHTLPGPDFVHICRRVELFWPLSRILLIGELAHVSLPACSLVVAFPWRLGPAALVELTRELLTDSRMQRAEQLTVWPITSDNRRTAATGERKR